MKLRPGCSRTILLLAVAGLATAATLGLPGGAGAYHIRHHNLRSHTVTYFSLLRGHGWEVKRAARAWNTSGVRIRLVRVAKRSKAQVVIRPRRGIGTGFTLLRYSRSGVVQFPISMYIDPGPARDRFERAMIIAHEWGHVFGLDHTRGCAVMNPAFPCQGDPKPGYWYCRILQTDDIRGGVRLLGGRVRPRLPKACPKGAGAVRPPAPPKSAPLEPPTGLAYAPPAPGEITATLSWRNADDPALASVRIAFAPSTTCLTNPNGPSLYTVEADAAPVGGQQVLGDVVVPAPDSRRVCVSAWSLSKDGDASAKAATAIVTIPAVAG